MKNKKYYTLITIPKLNVKFVERGEIHTPNTQIHARSLSYLGTDTAMKNGGVKLVLLDQSFTKTILT